MSAGCIKRKIELIAPNFVSFPPKSLGRLGVGNEHPSFSVWIRDAEEVNSDRWQRLEVALMHSKEAWLTADQLWEVACMVKQHKSFSPSCCAKQMHQTIFQSRFSLLQFGAGNSLSGETDEQKQTENEFDIENMPVANWIWRKAVKGPVRLLSNVYKW